MRRQGWMLGLPLLLLAGQAVAWKHVDSAALTNALESSGYTLIAFVVPSQEASKELEPEWETLQKTQNDENIVSFDCQENLKVCMDLDVVSFPSIRIYHRDGRMDRHRGARKASSIANFYLRALRPTVFEVTQHNVDDFFAVDDIVFIAHLQPDDWHLYERYRALASQYRDRYSFGIAPPIQKESAIGCNNNIDDEQHMITELGNVQALEDLVQQCAEPLIPELTRMNEAQYSQMGKSLLHYLVTSEAEKELYRAEMRPLAKRYREFVYLTITDVNEYPELPAMLGLKEGSKKGMALENPHNGDVFPYLGGRKISSSVIDKFLNDVVDGKAKAFKGPSAEGGGKHDEL